VAEKARRVYCLAYVSIITENNTRLDFLQVACIKEMEDGKMEMKKGLL
jgi:hypothetical protein